MLPLYIGTLPLDTNTFTLPLCHLKNTTLTTREGEIKTSRPHYLLHCVTDLREWTGMMTDSRSKHGGKTKVCYKILNKYLLALPHLLESQFHVIPPSVSASKASHVCLRGGGGEGWVGFFSGWWLHSSWLCLFNLQVINIDIVNFFNLGLWWCPRRWSLV